MKGARCSRHCSGNADPAAAERHAAGGICCEEGMAARPEQGYRRNANRDPRRGSARLRLPPRRHRRIFLTITHARRRCRPGTASNSARPVETVRPSWSSTVPLEASTAAAKSRSAARYVSTSSSISRMGGRMLAAGGRSTRSQECSLWKSSGIGSIDHRLARSRLEGPIFCRACWPPLSLFLFLPFLTRAMRPTCVQILFELICPTVWPYKPILQAPRDRGQGA
jgi:hypothetical protein